MIRKEDGFSLVEMAVVLVVVALVITALLSAKGIMSASQERSMYKHIEKMRGYLSVFKTQYGYYPGDFSRASSVFANCRADFTQGSTASNCNGNGDGKIFGAGEASRANEHLLLSGIWPDQDMTDMAGLAYTCNKAKLLTGNNIMGFSYKGKEISYAVGYDVDANIAKYPLYLSVGMFNTCDFIVSAFLSHFEMNKIDNKIDDGYPHTGMVISADHPTGTHSQPGTCKPTNITSYNVDAEGEFCAFHVVLKR